MRTSLRVVCSFLLLAQTNVSPVFGFQQFASGALQQGSFAINQPPVLEDGTPVRLRISQTVSSADAHVDDKVQFEVLEDIKVDDILVIPKGGLAWGTVTEAEPKRRMARGGKLEIVMDSVRLVDGEKAALRAVKDAKGGGHTGGMVAGIVVTGLILWPAAPFFLFMHGKDITIPKGTEVPTFVDGNVSLELAKFQQTAPGAVATPQSGATTNGAIATIAIASTPAGADIFVDQNFVGNTPSSIATSSGNHLISVRKQGYIDWERALAVSGGTVNLNAELVAGPNLPVAKSVANASNPPRQAGITGMTISTDPQTELLTTTSNASTSPGWIGVTTHDSETGKVVISKVVANGQGAQAGLQVGDVISELNGAPMDSGEQFDVAIAHCKPGSKAEIMYMRGAWKSQATVTIGKLGS
jgi:PDZ domain/PEGA domain